MVVHATKRGCGLPKPLLTQETIDARMREDKEAGLREYGNIFTTEGGEGQIIRRAAIIKNSYAMPPILVAEDNTHLYGLAYDPARNHDNSVVGVAEYYKDPVDGWRMKIINMVSMADTMKKKKTPINTPNQIKILKGLISGYVFPQDVEYSTLVSLLVDAGSGGAGVPITDFLCEDWADSDGHPRRGLIDVEYNEGDQKRYPNAVKGKLRLLSPTKYKSELYESLIKMMDSNLIDFPEEYMGKGYIELIYEVDAKGNKKLRKTYPSEEEEKKLAKSKISVVTETYWLTEEEESALKQIDAAKTELVNMYRFRQSTGKDRFDLAPDKANKIHDDRAYCVALLAWQLVQLRREKITRKKKDGRNLKSYCSIRPPKKVTSY